MTGFGFVRIFEKYFRKAIKYFFRFYIALTDQVEERCTSLKNKGRDQLFFQYVPTSKLNDVLVKKTLLEHFSRVNTFIFDKFLRLMNAFVISAALLPLADYTLGIFLQ